MSGTMNLLIGLAMGLNLVALASSRDIGLAMGVLMTRYQITREDAFDLLRIASQRTHRKLREVAKGWRMVGLGTIWSYVLDAPAIAGFIATAGVWVC